MDKKFKQFFESEGLTVDGNSAYGNLYGYEVSFAYRKFDSVSPVQVLIACYTTDEQKRLIDDELRKKAYKFLRWQFTRYGLFVGINGMTLGSVLKKLDDLIVGICDVLKLGGALGVGYCPVCGSELTADSQAYTVEKFFKVTMGNDCAGDLNRVIEAENADFENAPNNYLKGFLGALIGGLAGAVIAVLLYLVGFVASISSVVAVVVGARLYCKFGGKKNKMMLVIVTATSIVCVMASVLIIYVVAAGMAAAEAGVDLSAFGAFTYLLANEEEFARSFYTNLLMMGLFAILGVVFEVVAMRKMIQRPDKLK